MSKRRFKTFAPALVAVAAFDTQDNLVRVYENNTLGDWLPNLNLDADFEPQQKFGLRRHEATKLWFKSKVPVRTIRLNNFDKFYRVRKLSDYHFEVECYRLQEHFDNTDYVEVLVTLY